MSTVLLNEYMDTNIYGYGYMAYYDKNPIYRVVENKSKVVIFARVSIFKFIGLPVYKSQVTQVTKH